MQDFSYRSHPGAALITGASSGLGEVFARQLAARGYNLVLTARRTERLNALAAELVFRHNIQVESLTADLGTESGIHQIESHIATMADLELLVNNAGFGIRDNFRDGSLQKHLNMIEVHVLASVRLTYHALPGMIAHKKGGIINVSSVAAFVPGHVSYSATKAYLVAFSRALAAELTGTGVHVQALCPGFIHTEFHSTSENKGFKRASIPKILWLSADHVVSDSIQAILRGRPVVCIPGFQYQFISWIARSPVTSDIVQAVAGRLKAHRYRQV